MLVPTSTLTSSITGYAAPMGTVGVIMENQYLIKYYGYTLFV